MDKLEYLVESPPPPPRKQRRTPVRSRELGVAVAIEQRRKPVSKKEKGLAVTCRNGMFVMPKEAFDNNPMAIAICHLTVKIYNMTADFLMMKKSCESAMEVVEGPMLAELQHTLRKINKRVRGLRSLCHGYRQYVIVFENGRPVNEPTDWARV